MYTLYTVRGPSTRVISFASPFQFAGGGELRWTVSYNNKIFWRLWIESFDKTSLRWNLSETTKSETANGEADACAQHCSSLTMLLD